MEKFILGTSKTMLAILLFLYLGGNFCIIFTPTNFFSKILLMLMCLGYFVVAIYKALLKTSHTVKQFWQKNQDSWELKTVSDEILKAKLLGSSFVSGILIILHFKTIPKNRFAAVVIFKDALNPKRWRKLRIMLSLAA